MKLEHDERDRLIWERWELGDTTAEIAFEAGCSSSTVRRVLAGPLPVEQFLEPVPEQPDDRDEPDVSDESDGLDEADVGYISTGAFINLTAAALRLEPEPPSPEWQALVAEHGEAAVWHALADRAAEQGEGWIAAGCRRRAEGVASG